MGQFHFDPGRYLELMHAEVPGYEELQEEVARAAAGLPEATDVLELGTGTGETAERILALYPGARLTGVDSSPQMLAAARAKLGAQPALIVARLEDPLPHGPYDLAVSALAVHHLDAAGKRDLFGRVARAAAGLPEATDVLELGTGTGETAGRILALYPGARLTGVDSSPQMLAAARAKLGAQPALIVARLQDPLPHGPYDLAVSALAVHHLDADGKRDLFGRVARVLRPAGRFVLGDVVVPERPGDAVTPLTPGFDLPDTAADQLAWLDEAGFDAGLAWSLRDLAVFAATLR